MIQRFIIKLTAFFIITCIYPHHVLAMQKQKPKITCSCGKKLLRTNFAQHLLSKYHNKHKLPLPKLPKNKMVSQKQKSTHFAHNAVLSALKSTPATPIQALHTEVITPTKDSWEPLKITLKKLREKLPKLNISSLSPKN